MTANLTEAELEAITGYKDASYQLDVLYKRGFARAWIGRHGRVTAK